MALKRKSFMGTVIAALLFSHAVVVDPVQSVYQNGMNPGMAIRLEQKSFDAFKSAAQDFLPRYISNDMDLPKEYEYKFGFLTEWLTWSFKWHNIKYSDASFDFKDVKLILNREYDKQMLKIDFPALKKWEISALQETNSWFLPDFSPVRLEFANFDVDFNCYFELMQEGYLKPIVYAIDIKFG